MLNVKLAGGHLYGKQLFTWLPGGGTGVAKMLGKLSVSGRPTSLDDSRARTYIALAVGAGGGFLDIFSLIYLFAFLSPALWEMARYRLKYCFKGPLNPRQTTNHLAVAGGVFDGVFLCCLFSH